MGGGGETKTVSQTSREVKDKTGTLLNVKHVVQSTFQNM